MHDPLDRIPIAAALLIGTIALVGVAGLAAWVLG